MATKKETVKKGRGRPRKEIDYEILKGLCEIQCTGEECASVLGIDYDTLNNSLKRDGHGNFSDYFKKGRGRPRKDFDYEILKGLCEIQCTGEECASVLGIDYDTLNNKLKRDGHGNFSDYFKKMSLGGKASLRRTQYDVAVNGKSVPMLIWLGKQHLGQKDRGDITTDDKPVNVPVFKLVNIDGDEQ